MKSKDGADDPENIIQCSLREHYVCHLLLCKINNFDYKSMNAWQFLFDGKIKKAENLKFSSILVDKLRKIRRKEMSCDNHPFKGHHHSDELKQLFSKRYSGCGNPMYGKSSWEKCTPEQRADRAARYSQSMKGKNKGKHMWTNGHINKFQIESPGPEWRRGLTIKKKEYEEHT